MRSITTKTQISLTPFLVWFAVSITLRVYQRLLYLLTNQIAHQGFWIFNWPRLSLHSEDGYRLSKRQSQTTVLLRTSFTQMIFFSQENYRNTHKVFLYLLIILWTSFKHFDEFQLTLTHNTWLKFMILVQTLWVCSWILIKGKSITQILSMGTCFNTWIKAILQLQCLTTYFFSRSK